MSEMWHLIYRRQFSHVGMYTNNMNKTDICKQSRKYGREFNKLYGDVTGSNLSRWGEPKIILRACCQINSSLQNNECRR